jgi:hypothetical protein
MPDAPEDTYKRLMSRHDLVGLNDDQALEHIGELTDLSGDLRRTEGLERAMRLSEELQQRDLSAVHRPPPTTSWATCGRE